MINLKKIKIDNANSNSIYDIIYLKQNSRYYILKRNKSSNLYCYVKVNSFDDKFDFILLRYTSCSFTLKEFNTNSSEFYIKPNKNIFNLII